VSKKYLFKTQTQKEIVMNQLVASICNAVSSAIHSVCDTVVTTGQDITKATAAAIEEEVANTTQSLKHRCAGEKVLAVAQVIGVQIEIGANLIGGTGYLDVDPDVSVSSWGIDPHGRWVVYIPCEFAQGKNVDDMNSFERVTLVVFKRYSDSTSNTIAVCKTHGDKPNTVAGLDWAREDSLDGVLQLLRDGYRHTFELGYHTVLRMVERHTVPSVAEIVGE